MPYVHVWFELDGGLAHVVEDAARWPAGDLFFREVLGGMLRLPPDVVRRQQGRWPRRPSATDEQRVARFRERWVGGDFDWTKVLVEQS